MECGLCVNCCAIHFVLSRHLLWCCHAHAKSVSRIGAKGYHSIVAWQFCRKSQAITTWWYSREHRAMWYEKGTTAWQHKGTSVKQFYKSCLDSIAWRRQGTMVQYHDHFTDRYKILSQHDSAKAWEYDGVTVLQTDKRTWQHDNIKAWQCHRMITWQLCDARCCITQPIYILVNFLRYFEAFAISILWQVIDVYSDAVRPVILLFAELC